MKARLVLCFVAVLMIAACGPSPQTAAGFVVDVQSTSLTEITSFTLRTEDGEELAFRVGALDLNGGGFPGTHLREHMITNQPVAVAFDVEGQDRVATRLVDAPWLQP
jgi:hypothetical protein